LAEEDVAVAGAAWVKETETGRWYLYLVTPLVGKEGGKIPAYRRVNEVIRQIPQPFWVDPLEIKVVAPSSPFAADIADLQQRYPEGKPIRYGGWRLGEVSMEAAYIYPSVGSAV
jgi:hypothetical protein